MRLRIIVELFLLGSLTATTALPDVKNKSTFKAIHDFASQATGETSLHKGDLVNVLQQDASGTSSSLGIELVLCAALLNVSN